MMVARTIRDLSHTGDLWAVVESWAQRTGYKQLEGGDERRLYQRGTGFLIAPQMLEVRRSGDAVHLEAWIRGTMVARIMSFFVLPREIGIESGGVRAAAARRPARHHVNQLLEALGAEPIP